MNRCSPQIIERSGQLRFQVTRPQLVEGCLNGFSRDVRSGKPLSPTFGPVVEPATDDQRVVGIPCVRCVTNRRLQRDSNVKGNKFSDVHENVLCNDNQETSWNNTTFGDNTPRGVAATF